ncbi:hypothetical protein POPTR_001G132850v4 [Populus trichocarpa]|uniref:Uncharacterized protein n=1 Tax=Populus trichocarpa TaxID=3694 RepID=A0ACC0TJ55_POPTR|nr:hypothetical protein POPTR_001G132850v4 [Populus trichocarpa]
MLGSELNPPGLVIFDNHAIQCCAGVTCTYRLASSQKQHHGGTNLIRGHRSPSATRATTTTTTSLSRSKLTIVSAWRRELKQALTFFGS